MCLRARFTQYSLLLISQLVSLFHIYTLCLSHVVLASTLFLFFSFLFWSQWFITWGTMAVCGNYFITTYIQTKRKRKKEIERQCYDWYLMFAMWLHHRLHVLGLCFIQLVSLQLVDWFSQTKLWCKAQIRAICTYVGCTKVTTNNWDIRSSVTVKSLFANISWMTRWICMIKLVLESTHQTVSNDIWYIQ